jgi:hypothetical protein
VIVSLRRPVRSAGVLAAGAFLLALAGPCLCAPIVTDTPCCGAADEPRLAAAACCPAACGLAAPASRPGLLPEPAGVAAPAPGPLGAEIVPRASVGPIPVRPAPRALPAPPAVLRV